MNRRFTVLIPFAIVAALSAQQRLEPRVFVPPEPRCECFVDFAALKQLDIWDDLRESLLGSVLGVFEQHLGFALGDLDRLWSYPEVPTGEPLPEGRRRGGIAIFVGNDNVGLPALQEGERADKLESYEIHVEDHEGTMGDPDLWLLARSGFVVRATKHLIAPVFEPGHKPGVVDPELLSLAAGRGVLAHVVVQCNPHLLREMPWSPPEGALPADDPLRWFALRLRIEPPKDGVDEPIVMLEATLRCEFGTKGPAAWKALVSDALAQAGKHPRLGALRRIWTAIEVVVDGRDVKASFRLGRPRDAAGTLAMLMPFMMFTTVERVEVEMPPAAEPAQAAPEGARGEGRGRDRAP